MPRCCPPVGGYPASILSDGVSDPRPRIARMTIDYAVPGALTDLSGVRAEALDGIEIGPVGACRPAHTLVIQPADAEKLGVAAERLAENQIRPAARLVEA